MEKLGSRRKQILKFIEEEANKKGYPPSIREIGKAVGLSSSATVYTHLAKLEKDGYIRRGKAISRGIEILKGKEEFINLEKVKKIPVLGKIAAGKPLLAEENIEEWFPLPVDLVGKGELFMLKVKGDSMSGAGILDNDYVIVKKQSTCENGEIAVVLIEDEATVKRVFRKKDQLELQPENPTYKPIITKDATILGKVITLIRKI